MIALAATAAGEEPPAIGFGEEVSVGMVLVPAVVRTAGGGFVTGLAAEDFRLEVDGRRVRVESFERRLDAPLSLVFLQDLSGSMAGGGKLAASREAVRHFLDAARLGDEFAIATFASGATHVEVPFTSELPVLREDLATWEAYGTTALHDAVALLPEISAAGRAGKRAALLLTDGADNASSLPAAVARDVVRRAQVPVYVVGLGAGTPSAASRGQRRRYADLLALLARSSGGRYFPVAGPDELKEAVLEIADELRHQYVLGFTPNGAGERSHHTIGVSVPGRKVRVLARQGYVGTPPSSAPAAN